jgi:hypothetical protein
MNTAANTRPAVAWLILSAITLIYLAVDSPDHGSARTPSTLITTAAIALALIKMRIIVGEFMEVRRAPTLLRRLTDAWLLLIAAALLGSYYLGLATG